MQIPSTQLPPPSPEAVAHSQALATLIGRDAMAQGGWISFERYMQLALYAPGLGYYMGGAAKLGEPGDFVTAPELSSLFSLALARALAEMLPASGGQVLELGAGSGRMAADLLTALDRLECTPSRYLILEPSPELRARQQQRLARSGSGAAAQVYWIEQLPERFSGVIVANEVLDALPVHLLAWEVDAILERGVIPVQHGFAFEDRRLAEGELLATARVIDPARPYLSEVGLAARGLVRTLATALDRGVLLFLDYGFGAAEYYHPQRCQGTLMCHYRHRVHDDPFFLPGLQDITSHVDFTAVAHAGVDCGLELLGYTTQARFLVELGITDLLSRSAPEHSAEYAALAAQVHRLLSPSEMGELVKVIALGRGVQQPPGFARGDLRRLL